MVHKVPSQEAKRQHPCQNLADWRTAPYATSCQVYDVVEFKPHARGHWVNTQAPAVRADKH